MAEWICPEETMMLPLLLEELEVVERLGEMMLIGGGG
jgi:hypothetical protein